MQYESLLLLFFLVNQLSIRFAIDDNGTKVFSRTCLIIFYVSSFSNPLGWS
jgi:hypothetical protein